MTPQPNQRPVIDPHNVAEVLCDGQFHALRHGNFVTLTFTHGRPEPDPLFADGKLEPKAIVRARVVIINENLVALRDLLNRMVHDPHGSTVPAGGIKH